MQMFAFFLAMFSSVSWLIYAIMFVRSKLEAEGLWEQSPEIMLMLISVIVLPLLTIWMIFGYINQYINNKQINSKQTELLRQLQKNQDYTDLVVRVMLDAEHEIKDGFVINKFEVLINDMNEALSEIIQRCNLASSSQLEQLWQRVGRGERWTLGKTILEASKSRSTFDAWAREKVGRDNVFRGSLLEFCSRYQNLLQLLEKHDRDRVFLNMIEMGVLGKVYSIIAPLSSGMDSLTAAKDTADEQSNDYTSVLKLATMAEPTAQNTIMNIDKNDNEEFDDAEELEPKPSILSRFKFFGRKEEPQTSPSIADQDPFFRALHNSFKNDTGLNEPTFGSPSLASDESGLKADSPASAEESIGLNPTNNDFMKDFNSGFSATNDYIETQKETAPLTGFSDFTARLAAVRSETIQTTPSVETSFSDTVTPEPESSAPVENKNDDDNEDLVYPFGGWGNEAGNDQ
jgi:hypothetical protein